MMTMQTLFGSYTDLITDMIQGTIQVEQSAWDYHFIVEDTHITCILDDVEDDEIYMIWEEFMNMEVTDIQVLPGRTVVQVAFPDGFWE